jgi:hypothetical protein
LKKNIKYVIESENKQIVRSPGAILFQGVSDCKCYSLFAGGICEALGIPFCYRFASYRADNKQPGHVFIVVNPGTDNEIWIDPVLGKFNYQKQYVYKIDKKPKKMAIYQVSGIGRASRSQRKMQRRAKRVARRKAGKGFGQRLKKGLKGYVRVMATPTRNAFLLLVKINFANLAKKLDAAYRKNPSALANFWGKFGGRIDALVKAINSGKGKRRILGMNDNPDLPLIGVAPAAAAAAAAPIVAAVVKFLKDIGIKPEELVEVAKQGINRKAKELIAQQFVPKAEQEQEYEEQAEETFDDE